MSVARFIADQRTHYRVPHTICCALLGVSVAWFYKWIARAASPDAAAGLYTDRDRRRDALDRAVAAAFTDAKGLHGSPRLHADLRDAGWQVSQKTVADSMRRQGLVARRIKRRNGLTKQDRTAPKFPDLLKRNFTADRPDLKWVGDITEVPTAAGKLYLATVIDLFSRRLLGAATSVHPDAELACAAIQMALATRGGKAAIWRAEEPARVIFHSDRGSTGGFNWSSQHLDRGGVRQWRRRTGRRRRVMCPRVRVGSGVRIGRCGLRCVRPGGLSPHGRCSGSSGG
ncbi:IS3 family transposase [Mycobacterium sp. 050272]|uniref:IS3 family transposase n=1 Tax=Mycobacterium sp. 050272 TaxID=3142488 RepID=UPI003197A16F